MSVVLFRARTEARGRWRAWLGLALVIGLTGGLVTGLAAGAHRTATAYERLLVESAPSDVLVLDAGVLDPGARVDLALAAGLDGVEVAAEATGLFTFGGAVDGVDLPAFSVVPFSGSASELGRRIERSHLVAGRRADPQDAREIVVSFEAARRFDLHPGSVLELEMMPADRLLAATAEYLPGVADRVAGRDRRDLDLGAAGGARTYAFEVVGVTSAPMDFPPVPATLQPIVYPTPAFHEADGRHLAGNGVLIVRLDPDTTVEDYQARLQAANGGRGITYAGGGVDRAASTQRSIDLQAQALGVLALLVALAGALIVTQLLLRQATHERAEHETLAALGFRRRQLLALAGVRVGSEAVVASVTVVAVAVLVSPLFPIGTAAGAEPDPGVRLDAAAVLVGVILTAGVCLVAGSGVELIRGRRSPSRATSTALASVTARLPLTAGLGTRLALAPERGPRSVPVGSTLAALTVAVATAALAVTFVGGLNRLIETPRLYGWAWDVQIGGVGVPDISGPLTDGLAGNPGVESFAVGSVAQLEVDARRVDAYALDPVQGVVPAGVIEGRAPIAADEIVLGAVTLDESGRQIGERVTVGRQGQEVPMTIVGRAVFPNLGDAGQLGRGARLTHAGLERIAPGTPRSVVHVVFAPEAALLRRGGGPASGARRLPGPRGPTARRSGQLRRRHDLPGRGRGDGFAGGGRNPVAHLGVVDPAPADRPRRAQDDRPLPPEGRGRRRGPVHGAGRRGPPDRSPHRGGGRADGLDVGGRPDRVPRRAGDPGPSARDRGAGGAGAGQPRGGGPGVGRGADPAGPDPAHGVTRPRRVARGPAPVAR